MARRLFTYILLTLLTERTLAATEYAPIDVMCPERRLTRVASGLSDRESDWIAQRDAVVQPVLAQWLKDSNLSNFDVDKFLHDGAIRIGHAFSGGGYRAMLSGAGMLAALDSRTTGANGSGGLGGLLQASSYIAGLSGGSWLIGSVAMNNFTTVEDLQKSKDLWNFENVFNPTPTRSGFFGRLQLDWILQIVEDVLGKQSSGFPISLTDVWGRYLSAQTLGGQDHGRTMHWSNLLQSDILKNHQMPLPIVLCDSVVKNPIEIVSINSTIYEVTPFEFGSWDPTVYSFIETEYLGSPLNDGEPNTNEDCVTGYDNVGFLIGASSTLFNQFVQTALQQSDLLRSLYNDIVKRIIPSYLNSAIIGSNPFYDIDHVWDPIKFSNTLQLVDGGEDGENIPFSSLQQPVREVDTIFAFDNSADDVHNWPQGLSLISTYQRQFSPQGNGTLFPFIPEMGAFATLGLVEQPVFFGCSLNNSEAYDQPQVDQQPPLVIYLANTKHSYSSNFSTFKLSYNDTERDSMITNGYNIVTQNNGTLDSGWRTCVACAIILREQQRRGEEPTEQCAQCFSRYCYEEIATRATSKPNGSIYPDTRDTAEKVSEPAFGAGSRRDGHTNTLQNAHGLTTDELGMYEQDK